ncbi:MAG TPA: histidine phosphatase family protein [Pseudonocardia sp.]|nr:histidine phosphatase family protein [Pseudonocardia sp.]
MQRRLIVLRHAKSAWPDGVADHDRPLADRGRREAVLAGRWLAEHVGEIDVVVCSSAKRARRTWKLVAGQLDDAPEVRIDERLYAASQRQLVAVVRELPPRAGTALLLGHNPGLEDVVAHLSGVGCTLKTSSIAVLTSRSGWSAAAFRWARLGATVTPRR